MRLTSRLAVRLFLLVMVALFGAACSTGGGSRTGSAPQPAGGPVPATGGTLTGVVRGVDAQSRTLTLSAEAAPQLSLRTGDSQVLSYDASTTVSYQGGRYRPEDLEPGDRIQATVERAGNGWIARRIDVLSSVSDAVGGGAGAGSASTPGALDATVRWVDTRNRTVELEPLSGDRRAVVADYNGNTRVEYQGRAYRPEDLERGDVVQVRTRQAGGRLVADQIVVTQNAHATAGAAPNPVSPPGGDAGAGRAVLRGVISQIDRAGQRIALDSAGWAQGFDERAGTPRGSATNVLYDDRTIVEYRGKRYGVANLEPGDVVEIDVSQQGNALRADRIVVTRGA
jgi:Cu/Ag efflux protein CusF